jgi:hypothetical protein
VGRIRSIKPEFPQSESVGRLSRDARLLFVQLWTICDEICADRPTLEQDRPARSQWFSPKRIRFGQKGRAPVVNGRSSGTRASPSERKIPDFPEKKLCEPDPRGIPPCLSSARSQ